MRTRSWLLAAALLLCVPVGARAGDGSFQFAPPPFPILNMRSVDVEQNVSWDYVGMKMSGFRFDALNYGNSRAVKKWDRGGFSLGMNAQFIVGTGQFGGAGDDMTMIGYGLGLQPNWYFDLAGEEEDDFSLPFYFGPHLSGNFMFGSYSFQTVRQNGYTSYWTGFSWVNVPRYEQVTDTMFITMATLMYGWQAGIQAGINLGDSVKLVPYLDFSQELGGSVGTSMSSTYSGSSSDSVSIKSMPVAMQPGFDLMFRKAGLSLGGAIQNSKSASDTSEGVKTTVFHLRFQKKFRSICGI